MSYDLREVKKWENNVNKWDISEEFRKANYDGLLKHYGRDRFTVRWNGDNVAAANAHYKKYEGWMSHGYPATYWLQFGLIYGVGVYTATQQGILPRGQFFKKFWTHHYFDWLLFGRRSLIVGVGGGYLLGTFVFGDPKLAWARAINRTEYWLYGHNADFRCNEENYETKLNY